MLFGGYVVLREEAKRFTKSEGSIDDKMGCINIMIKFREIIMRHGGTMETFQYPKAIPDMENTAFLVITRAGSCSEAQFEARGRDHARLPQFSPSRGCEQSKRVLELMGLQEMKYITCYLPDDHIADFGEINYLFKKKARKPVHYASASSANA